MRNLMKVCKSFFLDCTFVGGLIPVGPLPKFCQNIFPCGFRSLADLFSSDFVALIQIRL